MEEIYDDLRQVAALAEIVHNETEDLGIAKDASTWKAWNRLVELSGLLEKQLRTLAVDVGELV